MIPFNVDWREGGHGAPVIELARQLQPRYVRCVSHPDQEWGAERYANLGIPTVAVFTGQSILPDGRWYVMRNCTAVQGANEPFEGGRASWPNVENVHAFREFWLRFRDATFQRHGDWFPLIGPGISYPRLDIWRMLRPVCEQVTAAACHVYPSATGHSVDEVRVMVRAFANVDDQIPTECTEFDTFWPDHLAYLYAILESCTDAAHFNWLNVPEHAMWGTEKLGIFRWAAA